MKRTHNQDTSDVSLLAIDQYKREVRWMGRLTEEEVLMLFRRVGLGRAERSNPSPDQCVLEFARDARNRLIEDYQPLLISIARQYVAYSQGMELPDLIQEGNLVLLHLFETCNFENPNNIIGFLCRCLHMGMQSALRDRDGLIKVSARTRQLAAKVRGVRSRLAVSLGREPLLQEVALEIGVDTAHLVEVEQLEGRARGVGSLHALFSDEDVEDRHCFESFYQSTASTDVARVTKIERAVHEAFEAVLPGRDREVMRLRYGIGSDEMFKQEEVADKLGVHSRTVQRAEKRAKERLSVVLAPLYEDVQDELIA